MASCDTDSIRQVRVSEAERDTVACALAAAHIEGRLTVDELERRQDAALNAVYCSDLEPLINDLPAGLTAGYWRQVTTSKAEVMSAALARVTADTPTLQRMTGIASAAAIVIGTIVAVAVFVHSQVTRDARDTLSAAERVMARPEAQDAVDMIDRFDETLAAKVGKAPPENADHRTVYVSRADDGALQFAVRSSSGLIVRSSRLGHPPT